jgi:serine-type D-Ala-D-Ala carboxypeptidase (penicillin-binding protein 5/6)
VLAVGAFQYFRALPTTVASPIVPASEPLGVAPALPWPTAGAAALYLEGAGVVGTSGGQSPTPMASTAKMMTALLVLEDHPLALGQPRPVIIVTQADVATYVAERNQNESVLPVAAGEQLSEYQLLQGLLLPSASNYGNMLAKWDLGDVATFVNHMNTRAAAMGMSATHYADVSGFSPLSVSIPSDLVTLARTAMGQPVFAAIVAQPQATLPVAGVVHNLDTLLGQGGVVGIKTGHTDQAGGCFVVAADLRVDGAAARIYGAVMGQPNALAGAFNATSTLLHALSPGLHLRPVITRNDVVARYRTPWDEAGEIVATQSIAWVLLDGTIVLRRVTLEDLPSTLPAGSRVGTLFIEAGSHQEEVPLVTATAINGPDAGWRLTRGF